LVIRSDIAHNVAAGDVNKIRVKSQNSHQNMGEWWHGTDKEMPAMR